MISDSEINRPNGLLMATPRIQSVDRAFRLLSELAGAPMGSRLGDLAARSGLSVATTHRILATLVANGAAIRTSRDGYRIGLRLHELAATVSTEALLAAAALPELRKLSAACGLIVQIGVLSPDFMVTYLAKHQPARGPKLATRMGSQLEAYCSGLGKALLSALPAELRQAYLSDAPFVALTANTVTDPVQLANELVTVVAQGFAVDDCEIYDRLRCVAVPIRRQGQTIAAISCSGDVGTVTLQRVPLLADQLHATAAVIVRKLFPS